jgi:hypothetical protein
VYNVSSRKNGSKLTWSGCITSTV